MLLRRLMNMYQQKLTVPPITPQRLDFHRPQIEIHREWLRNDEQRLHKFDALLRAQPESAICEALVAAQLSSWVDHVEPFENISLGGPDYLCTMGGGKFFVDSTCLRSDAVTRATGIRDFPWITETTSIGSLSQPIFGAVSDKVTQCASVDKPALVAIGILHVNASLMCVNAGAARDMLISDESYVIPIPTGCVYERESGQFVTGLRRSVFLQAANHSIQAKREPVAGVLLFGFAKHPPSVIGIINNNALRPFNPSLLPCVPFARAAVEDTRIKILWQNGEPE
jgi:hypothetical protein